MRATLTLLILAVNNDNNAVLKVVLKGVSMISPIEWVASLSHPQLASATVPQLRWSWRML
jgi:hypothetical protein